MSTLAAVILDNEALLALWKSQMLPPHSPLAQFHTKFWGVKESELLTDTRGTEHEDNNNVEVNGSTAMVDDIIRDSDGYVLDGIGIQGVENKILVRAEYIRVFKYAEEFYDANMPRMERASCLIITGQPGIGKRLWRWYALQACCAQKKPVIICLADTCWLFVEEGVFRQPTSFDPSYYKPFIWTLADSTDIDLNMHSNLTCLGAGYFVIYTKSPTPFFTGKLDQSVNTAVCVMNPWTKAEIHRAAPFRAPGVPLTAIDAIFDELGPTPRLCFGTESLLAQHRTSMDEALDRITSGHPECPVSIMDAASYKLYTLRRYPSVGVGSIWIDMVATSPFIASKIAAQMQTLQHHKLVYLFNHYNTDYTRAIAGDAFEAYCHIIFTTKIKFDFIPMVHIGGQPQTKAVMNLQWYTSHITFKGSNDSAALEALRVNALANKVSLSITPSCVVIYSLGEIAKGLQIKDDVYYIPLKINQVGIDSFILHNNNLYLLQMSVFPDHNISNKLLPFLLSLKGLPPQCNWHFIFVKPLHLHLSPCSITNCAELHDLVLYSTEVQVKS